MDLDKLLETGFALGASDVHLKADRRPVFRIHGDLQRYEQGEVITSVELAKAAFALMTDRQRQTFEQRREVDLAHEVPALGRFRVNIFQQMGNLAVVFRFIPLQIKTIEELNLPSVITKISDEQRGLVLVTGVTGSGKSTTLAAMIDHINETRPAHIITIEDPVEFVHQEKTAVINQREVGFDTSGFAPALRVALREDPDVILVGEMRDLETIETAILAAETGHLVLSTLHTLDATETINRIIAVFPPHQQEQIRLQLASIIKGVISQRLMPTADGKGRVPAVEVLVATARVRDCIADKLKTTEIRDAIAEGYTVYGMQTFDQSLMFLLTGEFITFEEAMRQASNPDDFALKVRGISASADTTWKEFEKKKEEPKKGPPLPVERLGKK